MGQAISRQYAAVVLRSQYRQLRALLAVALVAVVGLSVAVVILATDDEGITTASSAQRVEPIAYGGFNPATGQPLEGEFRTTYQPVQPPVQSTRPDESGVAAAIAPKPDVARPDESKIAASIARADQTREASRPDESGVATAIAGH